MGKPLSFNPADRELWKENDELRAKLAAAEKRIAELEEEMFLDAGQLGSRAGKKLRQILVDKANNSG